jgi:drug/metabolite transporter (DMT)-like permease
MRKAPSRLSAILLAALVTCLWSTSWVLIKLGLRSDLPPITFAGLRYSLAFVCLAPFVVLRAGPRRDLRGLDRRGWGRLALLGVITYTLTQTAQFIALSYLSAAMLSLLLNTTALFVAVSGIFLLREIPSPLQWAGILLAFLGIGVYFLPAAMPREQWIGILVALVCVGGNVATSLLGRKINRSEAHSPLLVTFASMGIGSILMLLLGLLTQGIGSMSAWDWAIVAWLALVNTALAFTIWNHTLRTLSAMESSVLNSLMMPQIAVLAYVFLKESITLKEVIGLVLLGIGVLIVQVRSPHALRPSTFYGRKPVPVGRAPDLPE